MANADDARRNLMKLSNMNPLKRLFPARARCLALFFSLLLLAGAPAAHAGSSCKANYSSWTLNLPSSVAVARDLPNGSLLTNWVSTPATTNYWTCTTSGGFGTGSDFWPAGIASTSPSGYTVTYNGISVSVYATNVAGVGIAMAGRVYANGCGWWPWKDMPNLGGQCNSNGTVTNGGQLAVALVKIGNIAPGTVSGMVSQAYSSEGAPIGHSTDNAAAGIQSFSITPVSVTTLTCQTPNMNINMGTHGPMDMPGVGSLSPNPASFNLQFNNCPSGSLVSGTSAGLLSSVQYRIDPGNGTVSGFSNVAALSGSPSAGGVGIQLFDSTGAVFPLGVNKALSGFNPGVAQSYSVPMTARYYRTGTVTPGPGNATMTLTVTYD